MIKINSISKIQVCTYMNGTFNEGYLQRNYTFEKVPHGVIQADISSAKRGVQKGMLVFRFC